ncbi:MAG: iron ABC transporter permease [SAR324 cluster bacterium]|nr:iron ABC transporter permease [SAR324 cluster bacterium]
MKIKHQGYLWFAGIIMTAGLVSIPLVGIAFTLFQPRWEIWKYLWETRLPELIWNTVRLAAAVGVGTFILGTSLAWLVVMYSFPGRKWLEGLLLLPLAMPGYVLAFVVVSQWDYFGVFPTMIRSWFGKDSWIPDVHSFFWVAMVMSLVLYPYVYLAARAAFREQNQELLNAARLLGTSHRQLFTRLALPLARPSITAGMALALMECLADFGTVGTFSYDTFTTAIYEMWYGMYDRHAGIQLAGMLLLCTLALFWIERKTRGKAEYFQLHGKRKPLMPKPLSGVKALIAAGYPMLVLTMSFFYPVGILLFWVTSGIDEKFDHRYLEALFNTLKLAGLAAMITLAVAILLAYGKRLFPFKMITGMIRFSSMGYALPGTVIAVGVLIPLGWLDRTLNDWSEQLWHQPVGLIFTGTIVGMLFAYVVRFLSVGFSAVDSSLVRVLPSMDMAAKTLGASRISILRKIHLPMIEGGLLTGFIIIFVDVMKELPATLILRSFGQDTLATRIWQLTKESYWADAALPALTIVMIAIIPVWLLIRSGRTKPEKDGDLS